MRTDVDQWEVGRVEGRGRQKKECKWKCARTYLILEGCDEIHACANDVR